MRYFLLSLIALLSGTAVSVADNVSSQAADMYESDVNSEISGLTRSIENGFERNVVVEEWSGTWCGFGPRGIVGMEYVGGYYSRFIPVNVHMDDEMSVNSYQPFLDVYSNSSVPGCLVNRKYLGLDPNIGDLMEAYLEEVSIPSPVKVDVTAYYDEESEEIPSEIYVSADAQFIMNEENADYRLAFVITENNVGPYEQSNYYSYGNFGEMHGWENKKDKVSTIYNHVARDIKGVFGIEGSLPSTLEAGTNYTYDTTLSTENVFGSLKDCSVVAMVIDSRGGEILNGATVNVLPAPKETLGMASLETETDIKILGKYGEIVLNGTYTVCEVYSLDGRKVSEADGARSVIVAPGIYVVRVLDPSGAAVTSKVIVK